MTKAQYEEEILEEEDMTEEEYGMEDVRVDFTKSKKDRGIAESGVKGLSKAYLIKHTHKDFMGNIHYDGPAVLKCSDKFGTVEINDEALTYEGVEVEAVDAKSKKIKDLDAYVSKKKRDFGKYVGGKRGNEYEAKHNRSAKPSNSIYEKGERTLGEIEVEIKHGDEITKELSDRARDNGFTI